MSPEASQPNLHNLKNPISKFSHICFPFLITAGGYDAVWLLVLDPRDCPHAELPSTRVEHVWSRWTKLKVTPLLAVESTASGAQVEDIDRVPGLGALLH